MRQKFEQSKAENKFLKRKLTEEVEYSSQLDTESDRLQNEFEQNLHGLGEKLNKSMADLLVSLFLRKEVLKNF